jgi:hypothetical protein
MDTCLVQYKGFTATPQSSVWNNWLYLASFITVLNDTEYY